MIEFSFNSISMWICVAFGVVCCIFEPRIVNRVSQAKCEKYGKLLPSESGSVWKRVLFQALCLLTCILFGLLMEPLPGLCACVAICTGLISAHIDLRIRIIPNEFSVLIAVAGLGLHLTQDPASVLVALGVAAVCAVAFLLVVFVSIKLQGSSGVGSGDFKFIVAMAFVASWPSVVPAFAALTVALVIVCAYELGLKRMNMKYKFPMCPSLCVGLLTGLIAPYVSELNAMFL